MTLYHIDCLKRRKNRPTEILNAKIDKEDDI